MDKEAKKENKNSPKRILLVVLIVFVAMILVAAIFIGISLYRSYVLYPRIDKALANAIEHKLDLGTKFDLSDMLRQGSSEFVLKDSGGVKELGGGINYGKKGATVHMSVDGERIDAVLNREGLAISADGIGEKEYYGIEFDSITDDIDTSFLNPQNGSDYAMAKQKYEELRTLIFQLDDLAHSKGEYAGSAKVILDTFALAHEQSPVYTEEHLRGEMIINGESRFARGVVYSFDHMSLTGYLDELAQLFAQPDEELREATERLICSGILKYEFERLLGRELSDCEDVANTLKSLARLVNVLFGGSNWSGKVSVAYVKNAISAIELSIDMKKMKIHALADFGAEPTKDRSMRFVFERETLDSAGKFIRSKAHTVEYDAKIEGKQSRAELIYTVCENVSDGTLDKNSQVLSLELDRKNGNARVAVEDRVEYYHPWAIEPNLSRRESIIDKSFEIKDRYSSLKLTASDQSELVLSRRAKRVNLPEYENILTMEIGQVDSLLDEFCEKYRWFVEKFEK